MRLLAKPSPLTANVINLFSKPFGAVIFVVRLGGYFCGVVFFSVINHMDLVWLFLWFLIAV